MAILSVNLLSIKSDATFLAASMRLGVKSCAVILPLTSIHKTISTPSPSACCSSFFVCGLANAIMIKANASNRNTNGNAWKKFSSNSASQNFLMKKLLLQPAAGYYFFIYQTIITGNNNPSQKKQRLPKDDIVEIVKNHFLLYLLIVTVQ